MLMCHSFKEVNRMDFGKKVCCMQRNIRFHWYITGILCCTLIWNLGFPAYAETKSEVFVIAYEDLNSLLKSGNFSLGQTEQSIDETKKPYQEAWEILKLEEEYMEQTAEEYEDEGNEEMQKFYENHAAMLKASSAQIYSIIRNLSSGSMEKAYEKQAKALTMAAQTLMNSYKQMESTITMLEKNAEYQLAVYESAKRKASVGMEMEVTVQQTQQEYEKQCQNLNSVKTQAERLKQNLLTMLGLDTMEEVEIGEIPTLDMALIDEISLEEDIETAISYDSTYLNEKHSKVRGYYEREMRTVRTEEAAANVEMSVMSTYQTLLQKKTAYDGAKCDFEAANQDYQSLKCKYQSGIISRLDYLQGEVQYLSRKADYENASRSLYQTYENYQWKLIGIK